MEKQRYVKTNIGDIPLEDYLDIESRKYGFEDYADLKSNGLSLEMPETFNPIVGMIQEKLFIDKKQE